MKGEIAVKLKGEIDHHSAGMLRASLDKLIDREQPARLVLDFRDVTLMDSAGVGLVLGRYRRLKKAGGALCVTHTNAHVDRVFRISGMYQVIEKR